MSTFNKTSNGRMNTFTICVPIGAESTLLRTMSRKMGWKMTVSRPKKKADPTLMTEAEFYKKIDRAKEQAKAGELGPKFGSALELIEHIKTL